MTSTLFQPRGSKKNAISAQDLLNLHDTVFKNGMLRKKGSKLNLGKWPHRLVVLTYDSIYVFADEAAKVQNSKFHLCGYNQVTRCEFKGQQWCFSIVPASNVDSVTAKTFACVSDAERKEWMKTIKNQMYVANQIPKPDKSFSDKFTSGAISDTDYNSLEKLVYSPTAGMHTLGDIFLYDDDDDDDDANSSAGSQGVVTKRNTSSTIETATVDKKRLNSSCTDSQNYETLDEDFAVRPSAKTLTEAGKRHNLEPDIKRPSQSSFDATESRRSNSSKPPRYSDVFVACDEDPGYENSDSDYVNSDIFKPKEKTPQTLESMCTILDTSLDRDQLIKILEAKKHGTYLIRKSRQDHQKVLSFLDQNGKVKEFKIFGTTERLSLDKIRFFSSLEDLLRYYSLAAPLPNLTESLQKGIHQQ